MFFSIYYNQPGNSLRFNITFDPSSTSSTAHSFAMDAHGAVFNHAAALVDYSACTQSLGTAPAQAPPPNCTPSAPVPGPAPDTDIRITQFFRGAFTTANGQRGTFAGSWTLNLVIITSQGDPPPGNQLQVEPAFLWNDGMGNGWGDAFGVWWRPTPDSASRGTTHKDCSGRVTGPSSLGRRCITHTQVAEQIQAVCQLASRGAGHWVIPADRRRRWSARSPRAARQQWTRGL